MVRLHRRTQYMAYYVLLCTLLVHIYIAISSLIKLLPGMLELVVWNQLWTRKKQKVPGIRFIALMS